MELLVPVLVLVGVAAILYAAFRPQPAKPVPAEEASETTEQPATE